MSILIKNMNMPNMCGQCRFAMAFDCMVSGNFIKEHNKINDDCPLILVPPHGRLIDADEFIRRVIGTKCFRGDYALMLEELVGESITIISSEEVNNV